MIDQARQNVYAARWREKNRQKVRLDNQKRKVSLKLRILAHYGESCKRCGYNNYKALHIDHIDNNGSEHRQSLGGKNFSGHTFYTWLEKNNYPQGYQTLCSNCNNIKQWDLTHLES